MQAVWSTRGQRGRYRVCDSPVAGQGMTYEAAAALVGTQTGTMKSRVSRARAFLADILGTANQQALA